MKKIRKDRRTKRTHRLLIGVIELLLVLILVLGLAGVYIYKSGEMALRAAAETKTPTITTDVAEQNQMRTEYEQKQQTTIPWQDGWVVYDDIVYEYNEDCLNFLLMGIDRGGKLVETTDWSAGQADTIFLISLNPTEKKISVIGIPRNAMVDLEIYNKEKECIDTIYNQICLQYGYAGGGELGLQKMKESVSGLFYDLPIHGSCAVSFDAISVVTDSLGGITVTVPDDMTAYNKNYSVGSKVTLSGKNVMPYLRYRDNVELGSPTTRLSRQKEFMKMAISTAVQEAKKNPAIVKEIYESIIPYMNTDITLDKAVYLVAQSLDYSVTESSFYQLTGEDRRVDFDKSQTETDFYDDYYLDEEYLKKTLIEVFYHKVKVETE